MQTHYRAFISAAVINFSYILSSFLLPAHAQPSYASPADIPAEAFAALPGFVDARLSPSGKKLAYFVELDGEKTFFVQNTNGDNPMQMTPPEKTSYLDFVWANDNVVLLRAILTLNRHVFRGKTTETRIFSLDFENMRLEWLGKPDKRDSGARTSQHERIVDMLPDDPDHILVQLDFELDGKADVYRVNVRNGRRRSAKIGNEGIQNWYADQNSEIRLGYGYRGKKWTVKFRQPGGNWINLNKTEWFQKANIEGFSEDPNTLYVSGTSEYGTKGLYKLDIPSGEVTERLFAHPEVDIDEVALHPITGQVAGVVYTNDYTRVEYFDKELRKVQRIIDKALPDTINTIMNSVAQKDWYLIRAENDRDPGVYYIFDRAKKQIHFMTTVRPQIDPEMMATVNKVSIPTRDGAEIPAYMVLPKGKDHKNLPTIVLPHGGPWARDDASWDYEAQFYASRGYLVLKPNFRGSEGYGYAFENAGNMQWGGLMQDDVTDATRWLIDEGYADPDRICIAGSSYGGYASLMGVIKEPGLYKCAISVNGVTNLVKLKVGDKNTIGGRVWITRMGLEGASDKDVSPYHRAEDISAPVLLMSAVDDARVPYKMSRDLHKKLKKLKKTSQYVKITEGTHYMVTAQSRLTQLKASEEFLAKHIGR
ncbi:alpha/beta hydrolase family protein [Kordiimonas aquimaris]|uniref:alpha/beta hydrolase family protein n=1 Tax=Kordiimonas aquimaris TaxID=707591 RepID=UPI0021CF64F4|nr:prolyl oligopeptidase family serine peptidase [Kordiimonas aquimaris]